MKIFKTAMTTTALATMLIAFGPKAYAMDDTGDRSTAPSKIRNFSTNFEEVKFELQPTGLAQKTEKNSNGTTTVLTGNNANADYQLESTRFPVTPGQKIQVPYDITVEENGAMSIGLLNSNRNGWYGTELILNAGPHKGLYERIVPEGEAVTSLVFRNYHLGVAGQTTFTINDIGIAKEVLKTSASNSSPEEALTFLLNVIAQNIPKATNILQEASTQSQPQQQSTLKTKFNDLAQGLLGDPEIAGPLSNVAGPNVVSEWIQDLKNSSRHDTERRNNSYYAQYTGGTTVRDHKLVTTAWKDTTNNTLVRMAAHGDDYLMQMFTRKQEIFPGLMDRVNSFKTKK